MDGEARAGAARLIRWAPRLRPLLLRRLYESDAQGIRDEERCDDVGTRLYERCRTLVAVSRFAVECPDCRRESIVPVQGATTCACGWSIGWDDYWRSVQHFDAAPGRAVEVYRAFLEAWPRARDYRAKLVAIDQLIHGFHVEESSGSQVKSVASKLLEGYKKEVVRFLDALSALDPAEKQRWREIMSGTIDARIMSD